MNDPLRPPRFSSDGEVEAAPVIPPTIYPPPDPPWERLQPHVEAALGLVITGGAIAVLWGCWELGRVFYHWLVR